MQQSVSKYTNQYTSMSRKFRDESVDDVLAPKTHHVVRGSWKVRKEHRSLARYFLQQLVLLLHIFGACCLYLQTEIDSTVREVLQAQQNGREQEGRLDALLLKALDESKVNSVNNYA